MSADPNKVMEIFCADQQLNISTAYLKPGFAYGGSCLQKDLDSFLKQSQKVELPLLGSIAESNEQMISKFVSRISHLGSVFIFNGLTFKENVDDLRNSPFVSVVLQLLKLDKTIYAFDDNLHELYGDSNRALNSMTQYPNFHLNVGYKQKKQTTSLYPATRPYTVVLSWNQSQISCCIQTLELTKYLHENFIHYNTITKFRRDCRSDYDDESHRIFRKPGL